MCVHPERWIMSFKESVDVWTKLGKVDPLWAILSDPEKVDGKWDEQEFFESGRKEIDSELKKIEGLGFDVRRGSALDFGCGVGRLTQALAHHFQDVHGVDVAETMIEGARQHDRSNGKCTYHVNPRSDLGLFTDDMFDFIYSRIVLQHIPPENTKQYVAEFVRVLKPGGLLAFQLPSELAQSDSPAHPFHVEIEVLSAIPAMRSGETCQVQVKVKNTSEVTWVAAGEVGGGGEFRLGNHWLLADRGVVVMDDGRVTIPRDMQPGDECEVTLDISAPAYGGDYILELDMVQEGKSWFKDYSGEVPQVQVGVKGPSRWIAELPHRIVRKLRRIASRIINTVRKPAEKPMFSMNSVPKDEVVALIEASGGRVSKLLDDVSAGPGWVSYFYYVTK